MVRISSSTPARTFFSVIVRMHLTNVKFFAFVLCLNLIQNNSLASNLDINSFEESAGDYFASGSKVLYRAFEQCGKVRFGDVLTCLKLRALKFADRALRSDSIQVVEGVNIVRSMPKAEDRSGRDINLEPIQEVNEAILPMEPEEKQDKLNEMLLERMARFLQTHSMQFDMPQLMDEISQLFDDHPVEKGKIFISLFILSLIYTKRNGGVYSSVNVVTKCRMHDQMPIPVSGGEIFSRDTASKTDLGTTIPLVNTRA